MIRSPSVWGLNHGLTVRLNDPDERRFGRDAPESGRIEFT
jgi:hypothetical protein